jgi:hypothetical protein
MLCPACGVDTPGSEGRCSSCQTPFAAATTSSGTTVYGEVATNEHDSETRFAPPDHAARSQGGGGPLRIGQRFGERYRIRTMLGVGGMGAVRSVRGPRSGVRPELRVRGS